jgi:hypothetical protein
VIFGSLVRVEATLVRGTLAEDGGGSGVEADEGRGINVQDDVTGDRGTLELVSSTLDHHQGIALFAAGSDLTIDGTLIRDIVPAAGKAGRGINLQPGVPSNQPAAATIRSSLVERVAELGIMVGGAQVTLQDSMVRDVISNPEGLFGDGIAVIAALGQLDVVGSTVERCARAGLSVFSGTAALDHSRLWCHPIDITVQDVGEGPGTLTDRGGNECGCGDQIEVCHASAAGLEPPATL